MNFDPALVSTIVPAFLVLIIAFYTLGGAIKGFRKSIFRFVSFLIFLAIGYFSMQWVAKFIVEGNGIATIRRYVDLSGLIGSSTDFAEAVDYIAVNTLNMTPDQDTIEMVGALVSLVVKVVYFIIYVVAIRIVYWIIEKIVWLIFFKHSRFYKKNYTMKKRSLGAVVGLSKGLIIAAFVGVAINGFVSIVPSFDFTALSGARESDHQLLTQGEPVTSQNILEQLDAMGLRPAFEALDVYRKTRFSQALTSVKVGGTPIEARVLDAIFTGTYKDFSIDGLSEIKNLVSIATAVADLYFDPNGFDPLTMEIAKLAPIFEAISGSELILKLIPIGINYAHNEGYFDDLPYGIVLAQDAFDGIDWVNDFTKMKELAIALSTMGNGTIQDFDYNDDANIQTIVAIIKNLTLIHEIMPLVVDAALQIPEVQDYVGVLTADLSTIDWGDELSAFADIYSAFKELGITSFDAIAADLLGTADTPELRSFFESIFASSFINSVFSEAVETAVHHFFADDETVGPLIDLITFSDITTTQWVNEFMTIVSIANDVAPGAEMPEMGPAIIANISADKIAQSQILIRAIKAFVATAYQEDSIAFSIGIQEYLKVPSSFHDFADPSWDADTDGDSIVEKDGEVINFIRGLKSLIDVLLEDSADLDFSTLDPSALIAGIDDALIADITNSTLLRVFVSNALLPMLEEAGGMLVIPDEIKQSIQVWALDAGNQPVQVAHSVLKKEELERLLKATKSLAGALFNPAGEFEFDMDNIMSLLGDPTFEEGLDYILGSSDGTITPSLILQATISKLILDMDIANGGMIVVPTSSMQTSFSIKQGETVALTSQPVIKGMQLRLLVDIIIDSNLDFANLDTVNLDLISQIVPSVNNGNLGNSDILNATFTKYLLDTMAGSIEIPKQVITKTAPGSQMLDSVDFLVKEELENLVLAIDAFGIDDTTTFGFELITTITDDSVWQTIVASKILQVTISGYIDDMAAGGSGLIVVPNDAAVIDGNDPMTLGSYEPNGTFSALDDTPLQVIRADEIRYLIRGINLLTTGLVNTTDADPNNDTLEDVLASSPVKIVENIDAANINLITTSKILYTTLSKFIFDLQPTILIPGYVDANTMASGGVVLALGNRFVVESSEILALLDGFSALGADMDTSFDVAAVLGRSEAEIQTIFGSVIVRATATKLVLDLADSATLVVPGYNATTQTVTLGESVDMMASTPVIQAQEYSNLVLSAKNLGLSDLTTAGLDALSVSNLLAQQTPIFGTLVGPNYVGGTSIFRATMSKMILDVRPNLTIANDDIALYLDTVNEYIATDEMLALLHALDALGISGLNTASVHVGVDTLTTLSDAALDTTLASNIMYYTMSVQIDTNATGTLDIPLDAYSNQEINDTGDYLLTSHEIKAFIQALDTLAVNDAASVNISDVLGLVTLQYAGSDITGYDADPVNGGSKALLDSVIIWNFVSKSIVDNSTTITIPPVVFDAVLTTRIGKDEIVKMLVSMKALGMTTTASLGVDLADLTSLSSTNLNVVLDSAIMYYTMSEKIRTNGTLTIPDDAYTALYIDGVGDPKLIKKTELVNFIQSLNSLGGSDVTDVKLTTIIGKVNYTYDGVDITAADTSEIASILESVIIWEFISNSIKSSASTLPTDLIVPKRAYIDADDTKRIEKLEIQNMLAAMGILGFDDPNTIVLDDTTVGDLTDVEFDLVLESNIMWYSISEFFISNPDPLVAGAAHAVTNPNDGNGDAYIEKADLITLKTMI